MNRLLVVGLVGIAFLTAVGLGAVALLDRAAPAAAVPAPLPPAPPPAAEPPPRPLPPLPPRPAPAAPQPVPQPAPPPPEPVAPLPADPVQRLRALGPLRRDTLAGLEELANSVRACRLPNAAITLTLETMEGRVRVAAVALQPAGAATADATGVPAVPLDESGVRCVTGALEGRVFEAQTARPGRRWEMAWGPGMAP